MEDGMKARGAAVALGAAAAIATFVVIRRDFGEGLSAFGLGANAPAAAEDALRFVWALCGAISAFAASTLVIATLAGLVEVTRVRRRVDALRHGPAADHWNMADWRSAFASSAVADRARP